MAFKAMSDVAEWMGDELLHISMTCMARRLFGLAARRVVIRPDYDFDESGLLLYSSSVRDRRRRQR